MFGVLLSCVYPMSRNVFPFSSAPPARRCGKETEGTQLRQVTGTGQEHIPHYIIPSIYTGGSYLERAGLGSGRGSGISQ